MFNDNTFMLILFIVYIICVFIEIKLLKRNNIDIFYKENFLLVLISSGVFPLAIFVLLFGYNAIRDIFWSNDKYDAIFIGYFFTFLLASLTYLIRYVKSKIYAFISRKNKLSFLGTKTIYDEKDKH